MSRKLLYFLIGFCIPFIIYDISYAEIDFDCFTAYAASSCGSDGTLCSWVEGYYESAADAAAACGATGGYCYNATISDSGCGDSVQIIVRSVTDSGYAWYVYGQGVPAEDTDGDGISDKYDLKPNSSDPYNAAIISVCYDSNNNIVAGIIQDDEGNQYMFGTMPEDMEGYTIETVSGNLIQYQTGESLANSLSKLNIDDFSLKDVGNSGIEVENDGTYVPGSSGPLDDWNQKEEDQTKAPTPDVDDAPSTPPEAGDSDSEHLKDIVSNTNSTNTNLQNIARYLGIGNDLLAKINDKTNSQSSTTSGNISLDIETPSAEEIGTAVKDNLIDTSQTFDTSSTSTIEDYDGTSIFDEYRIKYHERYDEFVNTIKSSDLFTVPFKIFEGPSSTGSSIQTVDIGKWGSSTQQQATIDYSDFDTVWEILRLVLLLITGILCFRILLLKKG